MVLDRLNFGKIQGVHSHRYQHEINYEMFQITMSCIYITIILYIIKVETCHCFVQTLIFLFIFDLVTVTVHLKI